MIGNFFVNGCKSSWIFWYIVSNRRISYESYLILISGKMWYLMLKSSYPWLWVQEFLRVLRYILVDDSIGVVGIVAGVICRTCCLEKDGWSLESFGCTIIVINEQRFSSSSSSAALWTNCAVCLSRCNFLKWRVYIGAIHSLLNVFLFRIASPYILFIF